MDAIETEQMFKRQTFESVDFHCKKGLAELKIGNLSEHVFSQVQAKALTR